MPPRATLAIAVSQANPEALAACVVLAYPHAVFNPCTSGLRGGTAAVAAALIDYDDHGGCCCWETHKPKMIMINYFLYTEA
jgi:hypothetical protein